MTFTLEIELGNDAMERSDDVRRALKELHRHLGDQWIRGQLLNREDGGKIMDVNGNSVGKWEVADGELYTVLHSHRHGISAYVVRSISEPGEDALIKALEIDFEPDREEWIEVDKVGEIVSI